MAKFYQKGYSNRLSNELRFCRNSSAWYNAQNIRILSRHHYRLIRAGAFRNKYASDRWINDGRGCGWGCIVSRRIFSY